MSIPHATFRINKVAGDVCNNLPFGNQRSSTLTDLSPYGLPQRDLCEGVMTSSGSSRSRQVGHLGPEGLETGASQGCPVKGGDLGVEGF